MAQQKPSDRIANLRAAETERFEELIRITRLDPRRHLRFADWTGVSFQGCNLRGFDFTGARLIGCDFTDALIEDARFEQAEIDFSRPYAKLDPARTSLRRARDWDRYTEGWQLASKIPSSNHLPIGAVFQDAPFAPEMVVVPAGTFWMGSPDGSGGDQGNVAEKNRRDNEGPRHQVTIAQPLAVGRFAVTFEEWEVYAKAKSLMLPDDNKWGGGSRPVISISWRNAQDYVAWLTEKTGHQYRLLSEAEWEYCCRAGTTTPFWTGEKITQAEANFSSRAGPEDLFPGRTVEVGSFAANPWGLFDVHGNVWEWVEDAFHGSYLGAPSDGSVWQSDDASYFHVLRGGSLGYDPRYLRSATRERGRRDSHGFVVGFRVARTL